MTLFAMQEYITLPEQLGSAIRAPDDGTMVKVVVMVKRKPGMSREAFIEYYETQHALLVAKHLRMFAGYRRSYMIPGSLVQLAHIAQVASPPDFDVMTEVWLRTHADFESLVTTIANPEIGRMLAEDEANLFDRSTIRMFRVEECVTPKAAIERAKRATAS